MRFLNDLEGAEWVRRCEARARRIAETARRIEQYNESKLKHRRPPEEYSSIRTRGEREGWTEYEIRQQQVIASASLAPLNVSRFDMQRGPEF